MKIAKLQNENLSEGFIKKFYDIKPRGKKTRLHGLGLKSVEKPNYFWDDNNLKIIPHRSVNKNSHRYKRALSKSLFVITVLLLLFGFIAVRAYQAKNRIENLSINAKEHLSQTFAAIKSGDMNTALNSAEKSSREIQLLRLNLQSWGQDSNAISYLSYKRSKISNLELLIRAADYSLSSIVEFRQNIGDQFSHAVKFSSSENAPLEQIMIDFDADNLNRIFNHTQQRLSDALQILDEVDPSLTAIDNFDLESAKVSIGNLKQSVELSGQLLKKDIPWLIGAEGEKKILILFANNTELRGGGGFIGSYAIADFKDKSLKSIDFQTNIYKLDNKFTAEHTVTPPIEINYINQGKWAMRDSNWALDFPESAAKVTEFYQLESGQRIDGVISMDTTLITDLLKLTGPISMPQYGFEVTDENFAEKIQYEVEIGYFGRSGGKEENEPKKILADMMPQFINKVLGNLSDSDKLMPTIAVFSKAITQKHLVFQFNNADFQHRLDQANYSGKIPQVKGDFLMLSNSNLGGGKSSQNVSENFIYQVDIKDDGSQKNSLEIERKHNGKDEWPDGYNKNLIRVLMPINSKIDKFDPQQGNFMPMAEEKFATELTSYPGEEAGYNKFTFWMNTQPKDTSRARLEYTQPGKYDLGQKVFYYQLRIQKQLGSNVDSYSLKIHYPKGFKPLNVENYDAKKREIIIEDKLNGDKTYKIKFINI